jgi:hypothetical protein
MEDLLIAILQGLFEFALEVLANVPFDWPLSARNGQSWLWFWDATSLQPSPA